MLGKPLAALFLALVSSASGACTILGDSIAVGLQKVKPDCRVFAKVGINTGQWGRTFNPENKGITDQLVVISLGTNDHSHIKTETQLTNIRRHIYANKVVWVLPSGNSKTSGVSIGDIKESVISVANQFQDSVIETKLLSGDKIHPSLDGYKDLAARL